MKQVRIICAAIHYKDSPLVKECTHNARNITEGVVIAGWRHHNCISTYYALTGIPTKDREVAVQGFLTSEGNFVDRKEAYKIARNANQLLLPHVQGCEEILTSEDLY